jgi:hypothetical protein
MAAPADRIVRVLVFRGKQRWVAQCLEFDLAAQADTLDGLWERLQMALEAERTLSASYGREPFKSLPPAPPRYLEMARRILADSEFPGELPGGGPGATMLGALWALQQPTATVLEA